METVIDRLAIESLDRYFEVVIASTPELLDRVYALRYQVYCVEHHFEDAAEYPSGREMDSYDAFSQHIALIYKPSGEMVGTARVILPAGILRPPLFSLLGEQANAKMREYPLDQMAEISRYVVSKRFRQRKDEDEFPDVGASDSDAESGKRLTGRISLEIIGGLLRLLVSQQVRYCCACMRPALLRLLSRLGFEFTPIGPLVEYHGLRQPCVAAVEDLMLGMRTPERVPT
jgi:N-acyl amino acid synthase of PEP-CTERM/exosortase system